MELAAFFLAAATYIAGSAAAPADNGLPIDLCHRADFKDCYRRNPGWDECYSLIKSSDMAVSVRTFGNKCRFYEDQFCGGDFFFGQGDMASLPDNWSNRISSIRCVRWNDPIER